jgi:hypothetical protein
MHRYIHDPRVDISVANLVNKSRDSARDLYTAGRNPGEHNAFEVRISFDDLMRNPAQRATNRFRVHDRDAGL